MAAGEPQEASAGVADQAGGDVQQGAQGVGGGFGQLRVVVEGEQSEPGEQVGGDRTVMHQAWLKAR